MYVNENVLEQGRDEESLFAFFHAQRTGGSAFLRWLNEVFPRERIFSRPTTGAGYAHWHKIDAARLDGFRVFGGFSQYSDKVDMVRPLVCVSLVRHPFYRIASVYEMSRRDKLHYRHEQAMRTTFEEYYREVDVQEPSYFRNMMCNRIGNVPSADAAIEMMSQRFGVVGITAKLCAMTELLARTYGWAVPLVKPVQPDEERYKAYANSPVFDDVMKKSAEDFKLYEFVRNFSQPLQTEAAQPPPPAIIRPEAATVSCTVCGASLAEPDEKGGCPGCKSPARTRSLPTVLAQIVVPQLDKTSNAALPLLAFAATGAERKLLEPHFRSIQSVSLYGKYASDNTMGVDVRDLSRYPDDSFSGAFGILLFDYFPEHEKALAELARVIAPGGILFTLILPARVLPDRSPPVVTREIKPRPGYFDYIPEDGLLLNVTVGQDWLLSAIAQAGFTPLQLRVPDPATDEVSQWFVGIRRGGVAPGVVKAADTPQSAAARPKTPPARPPVKPAPAIVHRATAPSVSRAPSIAKQTRMTDGFSQEFTCPLEGYDGLKTISVRLTVPSVPFAGRNADFTEHRWLVSENRSGLDVTCVGPGVIMTSNDLGQSWDLMEPPELAAKQLVNHFTTEAGNRLIQLTGWSENSNLPSEDYGAIYRLNTNGTVMDRLQNSGARWHGPRAIGEQGGVILYCDYFDNPHSSMMEQGTEEWDPKLRTCHVWRSDDDGRSWRSVFSKAPMEIRHFHFVMADPYSPGTWWLSSGDKPHECRCWRSDDKGESWHEVTNPKPDVRLHPLARRSLQSVFRATDMIVLPDKLIWGTDDILMFNDGYRLVMNDPERQGDFPAVGARIFSSPKSDPLQPTDIGIGGHPFRNLVDVGLGYLAFTEAKYAPIGFEPAVYFMGKDTPHRMQHLFNIPQMRDRGTGFSYSRASRAAVNGRFFSFRGAGDLTSLLPRLLQWDVAFA